MRKKRIFRRIRTEKITPLRESSSHEISNVHHTPLSAVRQEIFKCIRKIIGGAHFAHLWRITIALASLNGKKSLSKITKLYGKRRTRQAISHFLTEADWNAPELLLENAMTTLRRLGWRENDTLYAVLDDTQKKKRAERMQAVSKIYLHAEKVYATGHTIVACAFVYRGVVVPCAVRLWVKKELCKTLADPNDTTKPLSFRSLTELAADCIASLKTPSKGKMIVMFDKFYLCDTVVKACENKGFDYIGAAKSNRVFYPDKRPNDERKLSEYGPKVLDRDGKWTVVSGAKKKHRLAEKVGTMPKLGRVKLALASGRVKRNGLPSWETI